MVVGSRFIGDKSSEFQTTFMRRFGINIISAFIKLTTGTRILDTTSGYRLANRDIIRQFAARYPIKYPEPESIVHILKRKYKVVEAPANMFERAGGVSSITPIKSIRYMIEVCSSILIAAFMKESDNVHFVYCYASGFSSIPVFCLSEYQSKQLFCLSKPLCGLLLALY